MKRAHQHKKVVTKLETIQEKKSTKDQPSNNLAIPPGFILADIETPLSPAAKAPIPKVAPAKSSATSSTHPHAGSQISVVPAAAKPPVVAENPALSKAASSKNKSSLQEQDTDNLFSNSYVAFAMEFERRLQKLEQRHSAMNEKKNNDNTMDKKEDESCCCLLM